MPDPGSLASDLDDDAVVSRRVDALISTSIKFGLAFVGGWLFGLWQQAHWIVNH